MNTKEIVLTTFTAFFLGMLNQCDGPGPGQRSTCFTEYSGGASITKQEPADEIIP